MRAPLSRTVATLACALVACAGEAGQSAGGAGAPAAPPPPPAPPPAPVSADDLPPRLRVEADGIALTEHVDGRIRVKTTAVWGEALEQTFDNCDFYRGAIPTLERQLAPERIKHLSEMCPAPAPLVAVKPVKQGKQKVGPKPASKAKPTATAAPGPAAATAPAAAAAKPVASSR